LPDYLVVGVGFAFAAAVQPGPLQAFLLSRVAEHGWRRTLPAALSPLVSDVPVALVVLLVLRRLSGGMIRGLEVAGGLLLLYLAATAYRRLRRSPGAGAGGAPPGADQAPPASAPHTLLQAATVNLLNPNPYLGWSLVLGPAVLTAWSAGPMHAAVLLGAFYGTMVSSLALTIVVFGTAGFLGERQRRGLVLVSAVTLAALGVYQLVIGLRGSGPA
jgi:threonine/homoserine/homoserine lactone efflux protein